MITRNKRVIDRGLHSGLGVQIVRRLAARPDAMIENFRPGRLEKWGLGSEDAGARNPSGWSIMRVTGFGQTGPASDRPGFGTLAEAVSGFVAIDRARPTARHAAEVRAGGRGGGLAGAYLTIIAL